MLEVRRLFDIDFHTGDIADIVGLIVEAARSPQTTMLVTPNVHHVVALDRQLAPDVVATYRSADIYLCDSKVLGRLGRWSGLALTPRTGTDRVADVLMAPGNRDLVIALAGPTSAQAEALKVRYPDWQFRLIETPQRLQPGTDDWNRVVASAAEADWQILLSCLSFPKQELFAADVRSLRRERGGVILCVGAAVDFLSGSLPRAPDSWQRFGLEWLHRLLSEPRRLWRRYLVDGPKVFLIYLRRRRAGEP